MTGRGRPRKDRAKSPDPRRAKSPTPARAKSPTPARAKGVRQSKEPKSSPNVLKAGKSSVECVKKSDVVRHKSSAASESDPPKVDHDKHVGKNKQTADENKASRLSRKSSSVDADPDKVLQSTLDKLIIKRSERSESKTIINDVVKNIIDHMKHKSDCFYEIKELRTGSYYENVKISAPDEFDVMLTVPVERVDIQKFDAGGAFYSVAMKRHPQKHPLDRFLREDKTIRASEMLKVFRDEVKVVVKKKSGVKLEDKKTGSPAVTLLMTCNGMEISLDLVLGLEVHSMSWPLSTQGGLAIDNWLGTKVKTEYKRQPYYLVPKYEGRGTKEQDGVLAKDAWRISFSHVEKAILKNHGSVKTCCEARGTRCCRKQCLKLLKHLLSQLKAEHPRTLSKFCSYHAKTTLLHACAARVHDSEWPTTHLNDCFQQLLEDFEKKLREQKLPNFFIPTHNLLSCVEKKNCDSLAKYIEEQRNNGFPIFHQ